MADGVMVDWRWILRSSGVGRSREKWDATPRKKGADGPHGICKVELWLTVG
jgi:hypothetical protein